MLLIVVPRINLLFFNFVVRISAQTIKKYGDNGSPWRQPRVISKNDGSYNVNNIVFVCKTYYIDGLVKELGIKNNMGNPTYPPTSLSKDEILSSHKSVISSFGLSIKDDYVDLPSLYWIPKLHTCKCPYKERHIAGSAAKCSTTSLSKLLAAVLSRVKDGLQTCCDTA